MSDPHLPIPIDADAISWLRWALAGVASALGGVSAVGLAVIAWLYSLTQKVKEEDEQGRKALWASVNAQASAAAQAALADERRLADLLRDYATKDDLLALGREAKQDRAAMLRHFDAALGKARTEIVAAVKERKRDGRRDNS